MDLHRRQRIARWYGFVVFGLLVALGVAMALKVPGVDGNTWFMMVLNPVAAAIPAVVSGCFAYREKSPIRYVYGGFSAAMTFSTIGVIGNYMGESKFPGAFDYVYIGVYCCGAIGLLFATANKSLTYVLDGLIITSCLLFVTWGFVLDPIIKAFDGNYTAAAVSLLGPSFDVLLVVVSFVALVRGTTLLSRPLLLSFCVGITADAAAWISWAYTGRSDPEPILSQFLWIASGLIILLGVLVVPRSEAPQLKPVNFKFMLLPYPAVFAAIGSGAYMLATNSNLRGDVFVLGVIALVCLMCRQLLAGFENVRLARTLEGAVSKLRVREVELSHMALHDPLTSLPNRRFMEQRLIKYDQGATAFAVLLLDIDNFKTVNDELGHDAGDALLVKVAQDLSSSVRGNDFVVRLGGDEFVVVLTGADEQIALEVAARIRTALNATLGEMSVDGAKVGVSIGLSFGEDLSSLERVMRKADMAMYERKRTAGKGGLAISV